MASAFDGYTLKARQLPALIVVLPLWLAFAVWFPPDKQFAGVFASGGTTLVLGFLLSQIGRDAGKRRQESLFKEWGGKPTTLALSYRSRIANPITVARCHAAVRFLVPDLKLPLNEEEEKADWKSAKRNYESAADYLREATRDKAKFRLVYAENINYGFRRNLWGMKRGGIVVTIVAVLAVAAHILKRYSDAATVHGLDAASLLLCMLLLALWTGRFTKSWVKLAADEYASRLVASAEMLSKDRDAEKTSAKPKIEGEH